MKHPPYQLRANKSIDRFLLVEGLRRLDGVIKLSEYTYYGFGGPFLEDCKLLHEYFPTMSLVSIENDDHTYKRQQFHRFCKDIKLLKIDFADFLLNFESHGKEILWLDYTGMGYSEVQQFMNLLNIANNGTVIKVTVRAERNDSPHLLGPAEDRQKRDHQLQEFKKRIAQEFPDLCPSPIEDGDLRPGNLPAFFQKILQIAAEKALPAHAGSVFQPIDSAHYHDGTTMLSVAGIIWPLAEVDVVRQSMAGWRFANLTWERPRNLAIPILSVKERLFLEKHLSIHGNDEGVLSKVLDYNIGSDEEDTLKKLAQYSDFHRYYPYFAKVNM